MSGGWNEIGLDFGFTHLELPRASRYRFVIRTSFYPVSFVGGFPDFFNGKLSGRPFRFRENEVEVEDEEFEDEEFEDEEVEEEEVEEEKEKEKR